MSNYTVAVVGNPNSGKTTLFNGLTGGKQHVGNWPGVTVEKKEGSFRLGPISSFLSAPFQPGSVPALAAGEATSILEATRVRIVDLPGIYSLSASSEDQRVARDYILGGEPDLVVNVVDATNLERNLYLTTQILEMRAPVLVVLTMTDLLEDKRMSIDIAHLERHLGCPVVGINALDPRGIATIKAAVGRVIAAAHAADSAAGGGPDAPSLAKVPYPNEIEDVISAWSPHLTAGVVGLPVDERWAAVKILERDSWVMKRCLPYLSREVMDAATNRVREILKEDVDVLVADHRYGFIHGVVRDVVTRHSTRESRTDRIDRILTHRVLGIPIFLGAMYLVFWVTIQVGGAFIDFFDILLGTILVDGLSRLLLGVGSPAWIVSLLANGLGAGLQTVATFVPIIFMMFFMLSILEDSGYMARAAFVMDRFMRLIGLPGRSFVPMLVGFGCTIPAILGTRVLDSRRDRFMTIFMAPLMSCGARLPVYALVTAALFPGSGGLVVFTIYLAGIILAVLTGLLLKVTAFRGTPSHFIMELPPYHAPRIRHILIHTWTRLRAFIKRAGVVIVAFVVVLGFMNSFGRDDSGWGLGHEDTESSLLAAVGKAVTPVFGPLGIDRDNWPAAVGLFTGLFAKEAVVGTLNALYAQNAATLSGEGADDAEPDEPEPVFDLWGGIAEAFLSIPANLAGVLQALLDPFGLSILEDDEDALAEGIDVSRGTFELMRANFTPASAYAYLLFVLIYFPCVAALATAIREMGARFGTVLAVYLTGLAWAVSTLYFQIAAGGSVVWMAVALLVMAALAALLSVAGRMSEAGGAAGTV